MFLPWPGREDIQRGYLQRAKLEPKQLKPNVNSYGTICKAGKQARDKGQARKSLTRRPFEA
jgi:hypothetical protein